MELAKFWIGFGVGLLSGIILMLSLFILLLVSSKYQNKENHNG